MSHGDLKHQQQQQQEEREISAAPRLPSLSERREYSTHTLGDCIVDAHRIEFDANLLNPQSARNGTGIHTSGSNSGADKGREHRTS